MSPHVRQLSAIVMEYPLASHEILSKAAVSKCASMGWCVMDSAGRWIPTAKGIHAYWKYHRQA